MKDNVCRFNESISNAVNCTQFIYETSDIQSSPIKAASHILGIILQGNGSITLDGVVCDVCAGDIYVIKKGCVFSIKLDGDMAYSYVSFSGFRADELMERMDAHRRSRVFKNHGDIIDYWMSCFYKSEDGNLDLFSEAALLFTVANLSEKQKKQNDISGRIKKLVNDSFSNHRFGLVDIARELGYEKKYLSAVFKMQCGITFTEYLRSVRIKHAAFLFEEGIESVKSVALLSGFSDALYFSKVFKAETGISPTDYIKRNSKGQGEQVD